MKSGWILLLVSLIAVCSYVRAQPTSKEYRNLCAEVFRCLRSANCAKLDCAVTITGSDWEKGYHPGIDLRRNIYYKDGPYGEPGNDSIVFSPTELKYIDEALKSWAYRDWDTKVSFDSVSFFSKKFVDSIIVIDDKIGHLRAHGAFYERIFPCDLLEISHPVFLRNNTLCIVYTGSPFVFEDMSIYRKNNGIWKVYAELYSSIAD